MTRRALAAVLAFGVLAVSLAGCDLNAVPDKAPDGVTVSVYQPRPDVAKNRIAIQVLNNGTEPVTITSASLESSYFASTFSWGPRTATVVPGYAVDLRVDIPQDVVCDDSDPRQTVEYTWSQGDVTGYATATPDDPFHVLDLLHDAGCLIEKVGDIAVLTARSLTAPASMPGPAELVISVFPPPSSEGSYTIDSIHSTTLLNPAGPDGIGLPELDLGLVIDADSPPEIRIPIVPNRCDAHALAEDKVGTRMPLYVTLDDGTTGRLVLSADDDLRAEMYAFYSAYCSL